MPETLQKLISAEYSKKKSMFSLLDGGLPYAFDYSQFRNLSPKDVTTPNRDCQVFGDAYLTVVELFLGRSLKPHNHFMGWKRGNIMKSMESMKMDDIIQKLYVGMDIHEDYITGAAMRKDGVLEFSGNFPNTKEAAQCFLSGIPSPQVKIAIEACGLWRGVYNMLTDLGYNVVLADPVKTHYIVGTRDTDKVNAQTLADLLRTGYLPQVYIPTEDVLLLRDAARHRKRLVDLRTQLKCMTRSYLMREGTKCPKGWSKESMEFFRKAHPYTAQFINVIETINEQIDKMDKAIDGIAYNTFLSNLLQTTPGIGAFSSVMILGEIGDVKRFPHPKKLVKYAGLCPGIYQSGKKSYPVRNKACNKYLKWIMHECSGKAKTMDTKYQKHYCRVYRRKDEQTARRSTARKMLTDVWFMLTHEKEFTS